MTWYAYFRRLTVELLAFFIICTVVFYFVTDQESITGAIYMGMIASIFYGGMTYILRQRTIRRQDERWRR